MPLRAVDVRELETLATPGTVSAVVDPTGTAATRVLSVLLTPTEVSGVREWSLTARLSVCFVPAGAPLLDHRPAMANVRFLCGLCGEANLSDVDVTHALRLADLPDQKLHTKASRLDRLERLAVWLAVHRLRRSTTLVVEDPTRGLSQRSIDVVVRLLLEAAATPSAVVVTTPDAAFAAALAGRVVVLGPT